MPCAEAAGHGRRREHPNTTNKPREARAAPPRAGGSACLISRRVLSRDRGAVGSKHPGKRHYRNTGTQAHWAHRSRQVWVCGACASMEKAHAPVSPPPDRGT